VKDCAPSKVIRIDSETGSRPRIEIVIRTEIVKLAVDGPVTAESLAALAALANELRSTTPAGMAAGVGTDTLPAQRDELKLAGPGARDHAAGTQTELPRPDKPVTAMNGHAQVPAVTRFQRGIAATFRVAKDIMTELIARLLAHVLRFPP
jgi:hypothetical protein